jgi:uncharacterized protein (TIGR03083 family)
MTNVAPEATVPELIHTWQVALDDVASLCESLTPEEWQAQSPCPGWTVADVVAHVIDLEQLFGGEPRPVHEPDWANLPHVTGDFGRLTEHGVDYRRGRDPEVLLAELRATITSRRRQLDALPVDAEVIGPPAGKMMGLDRFLRARTFDTWVHEQDIRWAVGRDGGWNTGPAGIAFILMAGALPYVWGRNVKAPVGSTLRVAVIGPDLFHESVVTVGEDGRGVLIPSVTDPTVSAEMTWAAFMRLSCGRVAVDDPWLVGKTELVGDPELCARLLPAMSIAP